MEQLLNFFVSNAYAETTAPAAQQGSGFSLIIMFAVFFVLIYFTILRPQNKRAKEQQTLMNSISKGDEVITAGGLLGRITKITDQYITLTIANNVDIVMQKSSIVSVLPKGTLKSIE
jgi:preprotein translocase subunit YajC